MRPFLVALILLSPLSAFAQTTLDITLPDSSLCSYTTGAVTNGTTPGHLQATATSSSGNCSGGSSGNVTFGPASPASASPSNLGTNAGTANISFQAINATQCTGSFSPTGPSFPDHLDNVLCSGTACQSPVTVSASFDNESTSSSQTYSVKVACTGTAGSANSTTTVVAAAKGSGGGGTCATVPNSKGGVFTRLTGTVSIDHLGAGTTNGDITSFNAFFGTSAHPIWPGSYGQVSRVYLPTNNFVSLQFAVPQQFFTGVNLDVYGKYTVVESTSGYTAPISESISTSCGDFSDPTQSGTTVVCRKDSLADNGAITWTSTTGTVCQLQSGQTYYWNFINAGISNVTPGGGSATSTANSKCGSGKCFDGFYNKLGTWTD